MGLKKKKPEIKFTLSPTKNHAGTCWKKYYHPALKYYYGVSVVVLPGFGRIIN